jgi:S-adenosyl-L-methionine hydrolase (adenosine-forming)
MKIITFTTDFGLQDWFVGTMKGVILGLNPASVVVDITHEIGRGDIGAGAFALAAACRYFPTGTIHVAVVDPGVGSDRRAIVIQTGQYFFVGPDNGVLSLALRQERVVAVRALKNEQYFHLPISVNFHGRDVFAPVAAHLSRGVALSEFGPAVEDYVKLDWPQVQTSAAGIQGQAVYIDRFGNVITNIENELIAGQQMESLIISAGKTRLAVGSCYQAVAPGKPVGLLGSHGCLEIAVNGGSAARDLGLSIGDQIAILK